mmetsp:Transcript_32109/g.67934  ORF Transcript_32109/g.67934 Transcript_32109/m.67934 type:complete len:231 (-) Transcript_32109:368-1060(-)
MLMLGHIPGISIKLLMYETCHLIALQLVRSPHAPPKRIVRLFHFSPPRIQEGKSGKFIQISKHLSDSHGSIFYEADAARGLYADDGGRLADCLAVDLDVHYSIPDGIAIESVLHGVEASTTSTRFTPGNCDLIFYQRVFPTSAIVHVNMHRSIVITRKHSLQVPIGGQCDSFHGREIATKFCVEFPSFLCHQTINDGGGIAPICHARAGHNIAERSCSNNIIFVLGLGRG